MIARERPLIPVMLFVFLIGAVIGGGPTSTYVSMFVELPACMLMVIAIAGMIDGGCPKSAYPAVGLLALICLVPLAQLIPLPASVWAALPGRAIPAEISHIAGLNRLARPLSLVPEQTALAALSLIVPAAIFLATLQIGMRGRDQMLIAVVAFATASAMLGVFQVAAGGGLNLGLYRQYHEGFPIGFFANRNHEADLLLIAIPFSVYLARSRMGTQPKAMLVVAIALVFFALSVVATQSRTGLALLPVALVGALLILIGDLRDRRIWLGAGVMLAATVVGYAMLRLTPIGHHALARFNEVSEDLRPAIWRGSWSAVKTFWPAGSGVGGFVPIYKMFEELDSLDVAWVNHAHNDYLELILDAGIAAVILLVGYVVLLVRAVLTTPPPPLRGQRYAVMTAIIILLGHSITDYPLRTFGLAAIFAFCNAALFLPREAYRIRRSGMHPVSPQPDFTQPVAHA